MISILVYDIILDKERENHLKRIAWKKTYDRILLFFAIFTIMIALLTLWIGMTIPGIGPFSLGITMFLLSLRVFLFYLSSHQKWYFIFGLVLLVIFLLNIFAGISQIQAVFLS